MPNHPLRALVRAVAAACALLTSAPAAAYWEYGHETIARIAMSQVRLSTRLRIARLLRHGDRLGTPECPVRTIEQASTWADCIKPLKDAAGKNRFGYAYNWHFQNVDICQPFDLATPCAKGDCVSAQIVRQQARLADRSLPSAERMEALAFLVHLVGDLSQPLHAGDRGDLGGNKVRASYGVIGGRNNLHAIWDGYLTERAITTPPRGVGGLLREVPRGERRAMVAGDITDWSRDSWVVSRERAYGSLFSDPCAASTRQSGTTKRVMMDEALVASLVPDARRQIVAGGLRLAKLLDAALGGWPRPRWRRR